MAEVDPSFASLLGQILFMSQAIVSSSDRAPVLPGSWPFGVLPALLRDPLGVYESARELGALVELPLPFGTAYLLSAPALIQEVLQDRAGLFARPPLLRSLLESVGGENLMTLEGEAWLARRRLIQPHLRRADIAALAESIVTAIDDSLEGWPVGDDLELHTRLVSLTQEVVARTLLGVSIGDDPALGAAFATMTAYLAYRATNPFAPPLWVPTPRNLRARRARRYLDEVASALIVARRNNRDARPDVLSTLLAIRDHETGDGLQEEQLRREVQVMIGAGETTTSEALTFFFAVLAHDADLLARVTTEIDAVVGLRRPGVADIERLTLLKQSLGETLRMYPPSYALARAPTEDVNLGGVRVRRSSTLVICTYALHRDARYWADPARFNPDRFDAQGAPIDVPRYAYLPFGAGQRRCIGEHLAQLEMMLSVARILQRFRPTFPTQPGLALAPGFALGLAGGLHVSLERR